VDLKYHKYHAKAELGVGVNDKGEVTCTACGDCDCGTSSTQSKERRSVAFLCLNLARIDWGDDVSSVIEGLPLIDE